MQGLLNSRYVESDEASEGAMGGSNGWVEMMLEQVLELLRNIQLFRDTRNIPVFQVPFIKAFQQAGFR